VYFESLCYHVHLKLGGIEREEEEHQDIHNWKGWLLCSPLPFWTCLGLENYNKDWKGSREPSYSSESERESVLMDASPVGYIVFQHLGLGHLENNLGLETVLNHNGKTSNIEVPRSGTSSRQRPLARRVLITPPVHLWQSGVTGSQVFALAWVLSLLKTKL
jgi:hypothetical protein